MQGEGEVGGAMLTSKRTKVNQNKEKRVKRTEYSKKERRREKTGRETQPEQLRGGVSEK